MTDQADTHDNGATPAPDANPPVDISGLAFGDASMGPEFAPGDRLGVYKIVQLLGEGGFGVVYLAEQVEPVTRLVALKLIKPGMDTRRVVARFQAERQALAMMDHPGVARIYDAGATPAGRPYFAMEYVRGQPITTLCDARRMSIRQRLTLVMEVCRAIESAHQKGIIHRDLKPSNILVVTDQGKPRPKVIDFGIARAIHQDEPTNSLMTEQGQLIGTPEYMSPEQAEQRSDLLDTRTDIYSLGVLMYELLTGSRPFDGQNLRQGGVTGAQRIIREVEPSTPSQRVAQRGTASNTADAARVRRTDRRTLERQLRGDLDAITMHAMDKQPDRRYASVAQLREDIGRYLRKEPVTASPPSRRDTLAKFIARHRTAVVTAALIALALLASVVVTTGAYFREQRARQRAGTAQVQAMRAADEADAQRAEAERQAATARAATAQAQQAELQAKQAERQAQRDRDVAAVRAYLRDIALAQFAWQAGDFRLARRRLDAAGDQGAGWELDYLETIFDQSDGRLVLAGLDPTTSAIAQTRALGLVGDASGTLTIVDLDAMQLVGTLPLRAGPIAMLAVGPDDAYAAAITQAGRAVVVDLQTRQPIRTIDLSDRVISAVAMGPRGRELAVGAVDGSIELRSPRTGEPITRWPGDGQGITALAMSPDGTTLVAATRAGRVSVWNITQQRVVRELVTQGLVRALCLGGDGSTLATADESARVLIWDLDRGAVQADRSGLVLGEILGLALAPDGATLAIACADLSVTTWAWGTSGRVDRFSGHHGAVRSVGWVGPARNTQLVSIGLDAAARRWPADADPIQSLWTRAHNAAVSAVVFAGTDERAMTAAGDGSVVVRRAATLEPISSEPWPQTSALIAHATISRLGSLGASLTTTGRLIVHELSTGAVRRRIDLGPAWTGALAIDPFESWVAVGSEAGITRLIDLQGSEDHTLIAHDAAVTTLATDPTGRVLLTGGADGVVVAWDTEAWTRRATITAMTTPISALAVGPRGTRRAAGGTDGSILVWDDTGSSITLVGHDAPVTALCFDASGDRVFSAAADGSVVCWHARTGDEILGLVRAEAPVRALTMTPDGRRVVAGLADGSIAVWDASRSPITAGALAPSVVAPGADGPNAWIQDAYAADEHGRRITPRVGEPFTIAVIASSHDLPAGTPVLIRRVVDGRAFEQRASIARSPGAAVAVDMSLAGRWIVPGAGVVEVLVELVPELAGSAGETSTLDNSVRLRVEVLDALARPAPIEAPGR